MQQQLRQSLSLHTQTLTRTTADWLQAVHQQRRALQSDQEQQLTQFRQSLAYQIQAWLQATRTTHLALAQQQGEQLQAEVALRQASMESTLQSFQSTRLQMATQQQRDLNAFCQDLRTQVQQLQATALQQLQELQTQRQVAAKHLHEQLTQSTQQLRQRVWGDDPPQTQGNGHTSSNIAATPAAEPHLSTSSALSTYSPSEFRSASSESLETEAVQAGAAKVIPSQGTQTHASDFSQDTSSEELTTAQITESEDPILDFVLRYIENLQVNDPSMTMLQVIGNRDLVRDLLAKGAGELEVDPSEILLVLRQLVSTASLHA
jgi:hypothetical protein